MQNKHEFLFFFGNPNVEGGGEVGSSWLGQNPNFYRKFVLGNPLISLPFFQVKRQVETIILMWRNITPSAGLGLQEVPVWKEGEVVKEKRGHPPSHHTHDNVLLNLSQGREGANIERGKGHEARARGIPVHRLGEDARTLTADEYRMYSPIITEMRGGSRVRNRGSATSSSMAQVLVRQRPGAATATSPISPSLPGPPSQAAPPHLATLPATVPDQAEVLDLSSGPRRETLAQPPPRPVPPPSVGSRPMTAHHSSRNERPRHEDRALSLVGQSLSYCHNQQSTSTSSITNIDEIS